MGVLKLASSKTKNLELGEGSVLEVRAGFSKKQFRQLLDKLPESIGTDKGLTPAEADDFSTVVFEMLAVGWNLEDEDGNPVPCTVEFYEQLERPSASLIDQKLIEYFNELTPSQEERSKSKGDSK